MKQCPNCGRSFGDGQNFCSACGSALTAAEVPAETPAAEPRVREEKPPRERKKVGAGRRILAVLLCLLLSVFLLAPALGFAVRRATAEDGLCAVLGGIDLAETRVDPYFDDVDVALTLGEMLSEDLRLDAEPLEKVLNSSAVKNFLARQLAQIFDDIYAGRTRYALSAEELVEEMTEGKIARTLKKEGMALSAAEAAEVSRMLHQYGADDFFSRDMLADEAPEALRLVRTAFGTPTLIALLLVALVLMVLLFAVNRGRADLSFGDIGGTALAVGLLLTAAALFPRLLPEQWLVLCADNELAAAAAGGALYYNLIPSLILFGAGLLLAVLGRLLRPRRA